MEWASLPVLAPTKGAKRQLERGQSFYTGDGLNSAGVTAEQMEGAFARFLKQQPPLTYFRGLAAANETPALLTANNVDPPTYGGGGMLSPVAAAYDPVVTQRDTPLLSIDELLDLMRTENRVQYTPATTPRITSQQFSDDRTLDYKSYLYSSRNYKQTVLPRRETFWGIVTDVTTIPSEELTFRTAIDLMVQYALINEFNEPKLETVAYVYPLIDSQGNMLDYLPNDQEAKTLTIDRSIKYEAIYDRLSIGTDISTKVEKDAIVKVRLRGQNTNMARLVGVVGSPSTVFSNLIGGGGGVSGAAFGGPGSSPGQLDGTNPNNSPPGRIVGPIGEGVWEGVDAVVGKAEKTPISGICDMSCIPYLATNIVYHYSNNFTKGPIKGYNAPKAWIACRLLNSFYRAAEAAFKEGYGIIVYDAYRPHDAQIRMAEWADSIDKPCLYKGPSAEGGCGVMIRDPKSSGGSVHNRGAAFDISMYKIDKYPGLQAGTIVESENMGGPFDNILDPTTSKFKFGTGEVRVNRNKLQSFMKVGGFGVISNEWWHFEAGSGIPNEVRGPAGHIN